MSKTCDITGKSTLIGGRYSNRTRATQYNPVGKVRRKANLQSRRIWVPELKKFIQLTVSTKAIKTMAKRGVYQTLKKAGVV